MQNEAELEQLLKKASTIAATEPVELSVRSLLSHAGQKRRGSRVVRRIQAALEQFNLRSDPPFTDIWIDAKTSLVPATDQLSNSTPIGMKVSHIRSANRAVTFIHLDVTIEYALSLMESSDYSQLPVISGQRDLRGVVTWQSIAETRLRADNATIVDAMLPHPPEIALDDDLIPHVRRILDHNFAFVRSRDKRICGIITPYDLSNSFVELAEPFVVLEEIERRLRAFIDSTFSIDEIRSLANSGDAESIESVDDLSLGTVVALLEMPERFEKLRWRLVDRGVFVGSLKEIRRIRNELVHFSPDPLDPGDLQTLRNFAHWLRRVE